MCVCGNSEFLFKKTEGQVENSNSFQQIKEAFRNGDWFRNAEWRRFLLSFAAGMLWVGGGFGIAFVLGPPAVKLIVGVTMIYVVMRLGLAFWRA